MNFASEGKAALKARNAEAWGNAPGSRCREHPEALKARNSQLSKVPCRNWDS